MATTYDKTGTGPLLGVKAWQGRYGAYIVKNTIDLTGSALVSTDIYQCLAIPAGTKVIEVCIKMITPAVGTTLTMDVGDGGADDGWDASVDGKGVANTRTISANGTDARAVAADNGYLYTSADSIDVTMTTATAITAGPKFTIYALCVDYQ
jgi:hypothetical protein